MQIFNEEKYPNPDVILVLNKKEAQTLIEMNEAACNANKKKKSWKKLKQLLEEKAECF